MKACDIKLDLEEVCADGSLADAQSHFNRWLRFADDTHGQKDTYCRQTERRNRNEL